MTIMKKLPIAGWIGGAIVCAVILMALVSWVWTPYDPLHAYPEVRLQSSSLQHWLGTDRFGRDVLSQIMVGARITLAVGVVAVVVAAAIGVPLGVIAPCGGAPWRPSSCAHRTCCWRSRGYCWQSSPPPCLGDNTHRDGGHWVSERAGVRPDLPSGGAHGHVARLCGGRPNGETRQPVHCHPARAAEHHRGDYCAGVGVVRAGNPRGGGPELPGVGDTTAGPQLGRMLQSAQSSLTTAPYLAVWPGLAIAITVLGFNLLGDGLRDLYDPRLRDERHN